ncbi:hypothetical protein CHU98_g8471 [Xylaria longipes]|nr:hypothetical protein CHU98_g8471 [Xylaria longipes]
MRPYASPQPHLNERPLSARVVATLRDNISRLLDACSQTALSVSSIATLEAYECGLLMYKVRHARIYINTLVREEKDKAYIRLVTDLPEKLPELLSQALDLVIR